jgi:hypothetical protein
MHLHFCLQANILFFDVYFFNKIIKKKTTINIIIPSETKVGFSWQI